LPYFVVFQETKFRTLSTAEAEYIAAVGKQSVCSHTNCCDFRRGRPYDWGGAADTNLRIY